MLLVADYVRACMHEASGATYSCWSSCAHLQFARSQIRHEPIASRSIHAIEWFGNGTRGISGRTDAPPDKLFSVRCVPFCVGRDTIRQDYEYGTSYDRIAIARFILLKRTIGLLSSRAKRYQHFQEVVLSSGEKGGCCTCHPRHRRITVLTAYSPACDTR